MIVYLGSIYPKPLLDDLISRNQFVDYPANIFQHSLLSGLDEQFINLQVVTSPVIKSSRKSVKDICGRYVFSHRIDRAAKDIYVGTVPIRGIQMVSEFLKVYRQVKSISKDLSQDNQLIIYALHSPFLFAGILLKRRFKCINVIIPDLPEFMTNNKSSIRRRLKQIDRYIIDFCLKRLDCFTLLSSYMREKLPIKDKPYVLVEGIYDAANIIEAPKRGNDRVIFYGGSLSRRYGILELLRAFELIENKTYKLWICGDGDGQADVIKLAARDERVKFWGVVSHSEVLALQQQATVLINPRKSSDEYTKYSFPSKTMEYLASGTPTIMCHLPAIPQEYDKYIYYISDESAEGIKNKILEVCEKPQQELDDFGRMAAEFIREHKNAVVQAKKILDMMAAYSAVKN